jgi:hypothetical protein
VSANPDAVIPTDEQQAQLLERLRAAGGRPVSFDELRSLGIENPAVLCYELDAVGIPIARVHRYEGPGHAVPLGVRIEDPNLLAAIAATSARPVAAALGNWRVRVSEAGARTRAALRSTAAAVMARTDPNRRAIALAAIALLVLATTIAAIVAAAESGGPHARAAVAAGAPRHRAAGAASQLSASRALAISRAAATAAAGAQASAQPAGGTSARAQAARGAEPQPEREAGPSAAQLEARGHQLVGEGRYAAAIGLLHAALGASGESAADCGLPGSEACLTYAYALYDLGRALRLDGQSRAAVGVLSERLQIDNQRAIVRRELTQAKVTAAAGGHAAPTPTPKAGSVRKPDHRPPRHARALGRANTEDQTGGTLIVLPSQR